MPHWRGIWLSSSKPTGKQEGRGLAEALPPFASFATIALTSLLAQATCTRIAAMATHTLAPALSVCILSTSATPHQISRLFAPLLGANPTTRMNATSLRLQTALGSSTQSPQRRRRLQCLAESVDSNDTVAAGEQKLSQAKESVTEKQGPPVATILAGVAVAIVVFWGLWSLISFILGFFFR